MSDMFEKKDSQKKVEEQEQTSQEFKSTDIDYTEYHEAQDERAERLRNMMQSESKWSTQGLKPNTRRKKIGLICLVVGLVGYLLLQYVIRGS